MELVGELQYSCLVLVSYFILIKRAKKLLTMKRPVIMKRTTRKKRQPEQTGYYHHQPPPPPQKPPPPLTFNPDFDPLPIWLKHSSVNCLHIILIFFIFDHFGQSIDKGSLCNADTAPWPGIYYCVYRHNQTVIHINQTRVQAYINIYTYIHKVKSAQY